jgi:hypothetical protein
MLKITREVLISHHRWAKNEIITSTIPQQRREHQQPD